jgi:hypothetical protein
MDIKLQHLKKYAFPLSIVALIWLVFLLLFFRLAFNLGVRKGAYACKWSENYHRNFGGPSGENMMMDKDPSMPSHGVFGQVIGTATDTLIIKQNDGVETSVAVTDDTIIELLHQRVPLHEVHLYETVVVIGQPDENGRIEATFVRILPPPPNGAPTTMVPGTTPPTR